MKKVIILLSFILAQINLNCEITISKAQLDLFSGLEKMDSKIVKIALDNGANPLFIDNIHKKSGLELVLEKIENYEKIKLIKYSLFGLNGCLLLASSIITGLAVFSPEAKIPEDSNVTAKQFFFKNGPIVGSITLIVTYISYMLLNDTQNSHEIFMMFINKINENNIDIPEILLEYYKNHKLPKNIKESILSFIKEKN